MAEMSRKLHVLHIITGLDTGGAEMMLLKLVRRLNPSVNNFIIVLMERGTLSSQLDMHNVPVCYLGIRQGRFPNLNAIRKLINFARLSRPDVIQGWMYHGNLAAFLAKILLSPRTTLVWNVRQTLYEPENEKSLTGWVIKACAKLSKIPERIIYNSSLSMVQHERIGFKKSSSLVIPNGFELDIFKPDAELRKQGRIKLNIPPDFLLIGHVARFHPMKDHATMFRAVRKVVDERCNTRFVFVGRQMNIRNAEVTALIEALKLEKYVILLGERSDLNRIMNTFDLLVSSSAWGEGFPNVVGEAMATGIPCVVTDVGDSSHVVGEFGAVVPPANSSILADTILDVLASEEKSFKDLATQRRKRIASLFSAEQVSDSYLELYRKLKAE